jgi:hypothetical protein
LPWPIAKVIAELHGQPAWSIVQQHRVTTAVIRDIRAALQDARATEHLIYQKYLPLNWLKSTVSAPSAVTNAAVAMLRLAHHTGKKYTLGNLALEFISGADKFRATPC